MIEDNNCTMYEYILKREQGEDWEAMSFYNSTITRGEFFREVDKACAYFKEIGLVRGENIAICLPNIPSAIIAFYAANKLGIAVNLIHPLVPPLGLVKMLATVKSKVVLIMDIFYGQYEAELIKLGINCIICSAKDYLSLAYKCVLNVATASKTLAIKYGKKVASYAKVIGNREYTPISIEDYKDKGDQLAVYIHSGGTTGTPKIVMLANRAINECAYSISSIVKQVKRGQSMLMVLPMFHIFGLGVCMHSALYCNVNIIVVPSFNAKSVAKLIRKHRVTYATGVPSMYKKLLQERKFGGEYLKDMVCCYVGGDKLDGLTKTAFDTLMARYGSDCTLCEGYGLTEAGITTVNVKESSKPNSVGVPLGRIEIGIVNEKNNFMPNGTKGEICIKGDNLMSGYYNDRETTDKVLITANDGCKWVKTGDCGYIDESGHLYFLDRIKRMFKISGINVFPSEIERIVIENVRKVDKCCAVQFDYNGKRAVKLYVTLKEQPATELDKNGIKREVYNAIKTNLMKYSLPKAIEVVESLPITAIGKVDYKVLQDKERLHEN